MTKKIEKQQINNLLKEVTKEYSVFAPVKKMGGDVLFEKLPLAAEVNNISLDYADIVISPKDIFFPQVEEMFEINANTVKETVEMSPKFIFGIRPCDLKGLLFAGDFFKRNFEDKYYLSRGQDKFIVTLGCVKPPRPKACFCSSTETGPFAKDGYDIQLIDTGDFYLAETGSKKGEEFLIKHSQFFIEPDDGAEKTITGIKEKAAAAIELKVDFQKACELMADDKFLPEENYKKIGERCLYCGACLYTCPTCTCFNVFDDVNKKGEGVRARNWDGCIFQGYTREASGHNPRKDKWLRTARRYEHKLKYDPKTAQTSGCVGCGRCLASCPVDLGMSKFIEEISEKDRNL